MDVVIVGAGIVGLATALSLAHTEPTLRIAILEKEGSIGMHQTRHNSGVIHSGIYYRPGTLKAKLSVTGAKRMFEYCDAHAIPYVRCGKLILASTIEELLPLRDLLKRGQENGVHSLRRVSRDEIREIEPKAGGIEGIHSGATAIVDYGAVAQAMLSDILESGGMIHTDSCVLAIKETSSHVAVKTMRGTYHAAALVNCAGLQSDRVMRLSGGVPSAQIIPFRGEYYLLRKDRRNLVRGLIYPVPDPALPFLGVHLTRTVHNEVEAGPNAVLALSREGYRKSTISLRDLFETFRYPGFRHLATKYWRTGLYETHRSFSKRVFTQSLRRLIPDIQESDLVPGSAGVRAQAVRRDGSLLDDFLIEETPRALHVINTPSPAATASLSIGDYVAQRVLSALS